jgi:hypothetical protein
MVLGSAIKEMIEQVASEEPCGGILFFRNRSVVLNWSTLATFPLSFKLVCKAAEPLAECVYHGCML